MTGEVGSSRQEARERGLKFYHGTPCRKAGHTLRYTSNKACVGCQPYHTQSHNLGTRYGMSVEEYELRSSGQGHRCAICRETCPTGFRLAVDHNHKTGAVRGLLCINCNKGIGHLKDDPALLQAAINYLRKHEGEAHG